MSYASSVNKNWYGNENSFRFNHDLSAFFSSLLLVCVQEEKYKTRNS